ncbi:helix-turn-helix domain-containing protein [Mycobacterium sp. 1423905.2]|uniref:winged helix-turn-helix transcriptional regulator n=1 Tax=Mycobacterium sp. 1423905.2 TaxID=1856859 RepID=UPI0007FD8449|nr:helix-turn-helix domain-containing protein [Mycobacterium sp. 1423905.2]OBJ50902.1 HxlR family transcriptional regulator [Mycobacterium sp. 1423905.2]
MVNYRQYCPVAVAAEIIAERWNPLIVRNLMFGADTFSAIASGVPTMSRSMLLKRLDELQRAGVIETQRKPGGRGYHYRLTEAGADLAGVIAALGAWGERWVDVTADQSDPGFALWAWCQVQVDRSALPGGRVVVAFTFPEERPANRRFWMLIEHHAAELCHSDPGGQPDLTVEAKSQAFVDWHRGARSWRDVLRSGDVTISGPVRLRRAFPTWNLQAPVFDPELSDLAVKLELAR